MKKQYRHVSADERDMIAVMRARGVSLRSIARRLKRNVSTISREITRNGSPKYRLYRSQYAERRSRDRISAAHVRLRLKKPWIRRYVITKLKRGWSPELISGRLKKDHPALTISHEAIYQYIYDRRIRKVTDLVPLLIRAHKRRKHRGQSKRHTTSRIPNRVSIDERGRRANTRSEYGHYETDMIVSRKSKVGLHATIERKSRRGFLGKLPRKTAQNLRISLNKRLSHVPKRLRKSITYDNGSENTQHEKSNTVLGTKSYFCAPYHSWEKGAIERYNGLVRRYLPKGTDFATVSDEDIKRIKRLINTRPMKCLNYQTPNEVWSVALKG